MHSLLARMAAVTVFSVTTGTLVAQPPGGMPPSPMGPPPPTMLLSQKAVQDELKLTRDQLRKIGEVRTKEMQTLRPQPGMTPDKFEEKMEQAVKESEKALANILN